MYFEVGERLRTLMRGRDWYYKASFDKANRSSVAGARGPGLEAGLAIFREFKEQFPDVRLVTDIHECHQAAVLAPFIDCIQVPAFLCRQTDLLAECGKHFDRVSIKKGQWISAENILGAVDKVRTENVDAEVWLCERGTQLGYDRLVVDFRTVELLAGTFDKVLLDCTHSTQYATSRGGTSGDRTLAERYFVSAPIFGYSGVFAEVHPNPQAALSDPNCQIELTRLAPLISRYEAIAATACLADAGGEPL